MTPSAPLQGVTIVNVYLPLLTLSLGYAQALGVWEETGSAVPQPWRRTASPRMAWRAAAAAPQAWKTERG